MALGSTAVRLPLSQTPAHLLEHAPLRGLLITSDSALARAFRRERSHGGQAALFRSRSIRRSSAQATTRMLDTLGSASILTARSRLRMPCALRGVRGRARSSPC
jgi:hypothetical protein